MLEDGRVLEVANVIWCTGFDSGLSWIDLPIFGEYGEPVHEPGVVTGEPGLYFVGRLFLYAASSVMIHGSAAMRPAWSKQLSREPPLRAPARCAPAYQLRPRCRLNSHATAQA